MTAGSSRVLGTPTAQDASYEIDPMSVARAAADRISELSGAPRHDVAVVLGTGLTSSAQHLGNPAASFAFSELPGFPSAVPTGQRAEALSISVEDRRILVLRGRPHLYEGHSPYAVAHPVRTAVLAGCKSVVITNASGGIREDLAPGKLVLISDHLNLTGVSPLTGVEVTGRPAETKIPTPFVDLTDAWSARLRALVRGTNEGLSEGVYAQLPGPQFETPAEIRMLGVLGADLVGMSSVLEAIAARHLGAEVLGISLVSNLAAGISKKVSAQSVAEVARAGADALGELLRAVVTRL
jgi:purine-nucleoside phosphorylase